MLAKPELARSFALGLALIVTTAAGGTAAESWPQRTVRLIVPNPPGIANDVIARLFAEKLSEKWKQPVIVENLPGPDGLVAAREFVRRSDDHTLLYSFAALISINPLTIEKLPYDPAHDLVPIASTSDNFLAIAVSSSLNVNSLAELIQLARKRSGQLTWAATPGVPYYAFAAFQKESGLSMVQAHYRDFNQAITDLREGRIDAIAAGVLPLLPQARDGKIKFLAFLNGARSPAAPSVPTMAEEGYPAMKFEAVTGFFGWRDMPQPLREKIAADIGTVGDQPEVRERLAKLGSAVRGSTPAEFAAVIATQRAQIAAIAGEITKSGVPKQQ
ncbi:tripartite tricarboxylate transporter substrate binding protein [Pseudorhodoplanes sp.]|uniref:Bug family tripartite tricarboxylate transporter substrate binding protein n=1 Tax=Pseudorhodoplanes sp. TaxID=1934341 RepID=UPI002D0BE994|nr:tripartite tricarboxylate transporter substrate binding protein [Pseudorhodoplanes sp.]HWV54565.1 tripartite tricarboxylate transporter substrate binding protein [Pseudorhodoplanes sp.]